MKNDQRIVAIIQARMGANRLPGKVLKDIAGKPMLDWVVGRARLAKQIDEVVVATTTEVSDDAIVEFCTASRIQFFRGNLFDVLDRYYQAAKHFKANVVVRLTADCPLLDPALIDATIDEFQNKKLDFAANRLPPPWKRTYPVGLDVEVCSFAALERAWKEAKEPFEREHVMPYLYDQEGRFKISVLNTEREYSDQRWTVDTPEDLELMRKVYEHFKDIKKFGWKKVLKYFEQHTELAKINASVNQKSALDLDGRFNK
jgi:spore coat polysaccharide biosynthesis protein SpsF